jgi:HSP20 family protein
VFRKEEGKMTDLIRWRKGEDWGLTHMRREMDRLFDRFSEAWPFRGSAETGRWMPSLDVSETDKELIVRAELPGMDPKEIDISLTGNRLTIKGERKHEREEKKENFHLVERSSGSFSRSIQLPVEVSADKIKATYKDGVLSMSMPKTAPEAFKKIEVKAT